MGGDGQIKQKVLIDPQQDFNAAVCEDSWADTFKKNLKDFDFKAAINALPLKAMRHDSSIYNKHIWTEKKPLPKMELNDILGHEMPHVYKIKDLELFDEKIYDKGKIIVIDEIEKAGLGNKSFKDIFNHLTGVLEDMQASQARGQQLAEACHQGTTQPVAVRKPFAFRARAGA